MDGELNDFGVQGSAPGRALVVAYAGAASEAKTEHPLGGTAKIFAFYGDMYRMCEWYTNIIEYAYNIIYNI
jgi:hypothetical protein